MNDIIIVKALLSLVALIGIWLAGKQKGVFHKMITVFLAVAIFITWQRTPNIFLFSIFIQLLSAVLTCFYGIFVRSLNISERFFIITMGLMVTSGLLFRLQHWPYSVLISLLLIIPLTAFVVHLVISRKFASKEMSFMYIWTAIASVQFINNLIIIF
jgi:hypothetical protein